MKYEGNVRVRKTTANVKGQLIEFDECYIVDDNGNEVFDRNIEIDNDARLYDIYKKINKLLTRNEIKEIRLKYSLNQKEFANILGVGEITIHRFEKGSIQTDSVDAIIRLAKEPNNMLMLLNQNKDNISQELFKNTYNKIQSLLKDKKHALINKNKIDLKANFLTTDVNSVSDNIIKIYNDMMQEISSKYDIIPEYITNLKLQKLLYYVQGHCLTLFNKPAFNEKIIAWNYGPVVEEIYQEYKDFHKKEITTKQRVKKISTGLEQIIKEVVINYGSIDATKLIDLTHEEEPWQNTYINTEIEKEIISNYFKKIYMN